MAEKIKAGDTYSHSFTFTQQQVELFAEVTGDKNPIHLDAAYAASTPFKQPIMHGFLGGAVFSKVFGTLFPGEGTIYLKQSMAFTKPMLAGQEYEAQFTVREVNEEKHRAIVDTLMVEKSSGEATIKGEATVMNTTRL